MSAWRGIYNTSGACGTHGRTMRIPARLPSARTALLVLTGINLFNYLDRYVLGAVLPAMTTALGISDAEAGSLPTVFILTFALVSPLAGWLGDRQPRFRLAAIGVFVWSLATFASGLAQTFAALVVARAITGVGEASYTVVTPSLLSDFYPPDRRGRVLAFFYAAIPIGSAAGFVVGGEVNAHWGWRAAFFVAGAPGAALAAVLLGFRDPPRGRPRPEERRRPAVRAGGARGPCGRGRATSTTPSRRPSSRSPWAGSRSGCRPTSSGCATCRSHSPTSGSAACWWWRASPARSPGGEPAIGWRAAAPTDTSSSRPSRSSRRSRSRCSRSSTPPLLSSGRRCSQASPCCSSAAARSTRRWPTCCRPSCGRGASRSAAWRFTCWATPRRRS